MNFQVAKMVHNNCRGGLYPFSLVKRFPVPTDKVSWSTRYPEYDPPEYTSPSINGKPWSDPDSKETLFRPKWNQLDGNINRKSYAIYKFDENGRPLNPVGRTGIIGRGVLGRWGPNHAADPIVTRWKRDKLGKIKMNKLSGKPEMQFIGIQRKDTKQWAIPGGMVDGDEIVTATLKREFMEEALNALEKTSDELEKIKNSIDLLFSRGDEIYKGYVDDPRNTDNSWMETCAYNFHDEDGKIVANVPFEAGDDASNVRWIDIEKSLNLYANHIHFIELTMKLRNAHW